MPSFGLGTFEAHEGSALNDALHHALKTGYRLIDTAQVYKNESIIGESLWPSCHQLGIPRDEIFLTTKLSPSNQTYGKVLQSIEESLANLATRYIDLFLIHWPGASRVPVTNGVVNSERRMGCWRALIEARSAGLVRSIGVSNYTCNHMEELIAAGVAFMPAVNQVEIHPGYCPEEDVRWCRSHGVVVQGYSSLGRAGRQKGTASLLDNPTVIQIASELSLESSSVCLLWSLQQGFPIIPKAVRQQHITSNWNTYSGLNRLTADHMHRIAVEIPQKKVCWDPKYVC